MFFMTYYDFPRKTGEREGQLSIIKEQTRIESASLNGIFFSLLHSLTRQTFKRYLPVCIQHKSQAKSQGGFIRAVISPWKAKSHRGASPGGFFPNEHARSPSLYPHAKRSEIKLKEKSCKFSDPPGMHHVCSITACFCFLDRVLVFRTDVWTYGHLMQN